MSERWSIEAPGKLMLAGEYSVLAPQGRAIAVALPFGVRGELTKAEQWELARPESGARWLPVDGLAAAPPALRYAAQAFSECSTRWGSLPPHRLLLASASANTPGPAEDRVSAGGPSAKRGYGGSAAASVATVAACWAARAGLDTGVEVPTAEIAELAHAAHRSAQGHRGSGYDIHTIVRGGLVETRLVDGAPRSRSMAWPEGLLMLAGYCGRSASTRRQLRKLEALMRRDAQQATNDLCALGRPVTELVEALERADLRTVLAAVRRAHRAVLSWDQKYQLGIVTPAIARMVAIAEEHQAAAKISGAGAGDSVLALASSRPRLEQLAHAWRRAGFAPQEVSLATGLRVQCGCNS